MTQRTTQPPTQARGTPQHRMPFYWADYLTSPLRGQLALAGDHLTRMAYLELLGKLWEQGGTIRRDEVAGALLVSDEDAERAVSKLVASGRIECSEDGVLSNPRVTRDLQALQRFLEQQRELGKKGGEARAKRRSSPRSASAKLSLSEPLASQSRSRSLSRSQSQEPLPLPEPPERDSRESRIAARLTSIVNAVAGKRLGRNRALEESCSKALVAGYPEDEILGALWAGLCGPDDWWRSEGKGGADLMLLLRFKGGVNPTTGQPVRQWLPEMLAHFPEVFPQFVREACAKLAAAGEEAEIEWLRARGVRGSS